MSAPALAGREDIVTFVMAPSVDADLADRTVIKRVAGLPGDVMACRDGAVLRNGSLIAYAAYVLVLTRTPHWCGDVHRC